MQNFEFHNTTKILFGEGKIETLANEIPKDKKVLLAYGGGSIKKNGVYDQAMTALKDHKVIEFSGIEPNPHYDTLMKAVELVKNENVDFILAVGGGSVIDGCKFISAAVHYEGDEPWHIMEKQEKIESALPLGTILTLPATGSESNGNFVVTRGNEKMGYSSQLVFPQFSILDPTVTYSLPEKQTANGVVDAFVHVMEQYLTHPVQARVQDRFAEGLLQTLTEVGPQILKTPEDYDLRANIMWSATLALNTLIGKGVPQDWATHMIGHELTGLFGMDHAQTLAIVLPAVLKERHEKKHDKLIQYAERVWNIQEGSDEEKVNAAIEKTESFFKEMKLSTRLSEENISEDEIPNILKQLEKHGMTELGEDGNVDLAMSERILRRAL
ncbi:iron-containing alcohol dehydrogenase [Flocculibacter collagenilyticus]|uniref:iron-containing alcohol dehydrogenase n=1 Tax=Flocculibacter collagenilyticus TaxID=2744479 RepID=UPI0018F60FAA|nr:iron-containing alcohol dehydrogenase [Flocculibacter collagenilyticus]